MVKCLRAAALVFVAGNLCAAVPPASGQNEAHSSRFTSGVPSRRLPALMGMPSRGGRMT